MARAGAVSILVTVQRTLLCNGRRPEGRPASIFSAEVAFVRWQPRMALIAVSCVDMRSVEECFGLVLLVCAYYWLGVRPYM
jgi:hypothetical protein